MLTFDSFCKKSDEPCYYCGAIKDSYVKDRASDYILHYNGLDRIDSSKGYTEENTVSACKWCNISKSEMSELEFKEFIIRIHDYQRKKKL